MSKIVLFSLTSHIKPKHNQFTNTYIKDKQKKISEFRNWDKEIFGILLEKQLKALHIYMQVHAYNITESHPSLVEKIMT